MEKFKFQQQDGRIFLQKGKYLVQDACYSYDEECWSKLCDRMFSGDRSDIQKDEEGNEFLVIGTYSGDGRYFCYDNTRKMGGEIGVDSGAIGIIPLKVAKSWKRYNVKFGIIVELKEDSAFSASNGNFEFGPFKVITDGSDEENDCCGRECDCCR